MTGKIVDDRYEIIKSLGKGGMGEVYLAQHVKLEQFRVVLKEQLGIQPGQEQQALDEANNLAKVSTGCRHVCRIVDFFTDGGKAWLVMDHVEGSNIADLISKEEKLTWQQTYSTAEQILRGLSCIHRKGVFHRDIKPSNIMLDADNEAWIIDFGIAKGQSNLLATISGAPPVGTPAYMAPEQFQSHNVDYRLSDIYALGTTMYHMICGRLPFEFESFEELIRVKQTADPIPPKTFVPDLPDWFESLLLKAIERDPGQRYASTSEMLTALMSGGVAHHPTRPVSSPQVHPPRPLAPRHLSRIKDRKPHFSWSAVGRDYTYVVERADSPDFANTTELCRTTETTFNPQTKLPSGPVFWRVKSINPKGVESPTSQLSGFEIEAPSPYKWLILAGLAIGLSALMIFIRPIMCTEFGLFCPPSPIALEPPDLETFSAADTINFMWRPSTSDDVDHSLEWSSGTSFEDRRILAVVSGSTYQLATSIPVGTYYWRVSADDRNSSAIVYSEQRQFTIEKGDTAAPPLLQSPAFGALLTAENRPAFIWNYADTMVDSFILEYGPDQVFLNTRRVGPMAGRSYTPESPLQNTTFYWRVCSFSGQKGPGPFSEPWNFTVRYAPPSFLVLNVTCPCSLYVDDRLYAAGVTSRSIELTPGTHRIRLSTNYSAEKEISDTFTLNVGQSLEKSYALTCIAKVFVRVPGELSGNIFVDNVLVSDIIPNTLDIAPGIRSIRVTDPANPNRYAEDQLVIKGGNDYILTADWKLRMLDLKQK